MMGQEFSYGVIPFQRRNGEWKVLLVQLHAGHWGFPKGHAEREEPEQETAARELQEETGLTIRYWLPIPPFHENYVLTKEGKEIQKQVAYFAAIVDGEVGVQETEVKDCQWVPLNALEQAPTFPAAKAVAQKVLDACTPDKLNLWDANA